LESERKRGIIARIFHDRGYGFINQRDGKSVFFHIGDLDGVSFDSLYVGQHVEYNPIQKPKGLTANDLEIIDGVMEVTKEKW